MATRAFITGISGSTLTPAERSFLRESEPWGLILFARNIDTPAQVKRLTGSVRDALGRDAPVLVDHLHPALEHLVRRFHAVSHPR